MFSVIVAATREGGIGREGKIPWHLPADLQHFRETTSRTTEPTKINTVIMGRKTWDSIPEKNRPLPNRYNIVISKTLADLKVDRMSVVPDFASALKLATQKETIERIFVIGGAQVYAEALRHPGCRNIYLTQLLHRIECDTFMPPIDPQVFQLTSEGPLHFDLPPGTLLEEGEAVYLQLPGPSFQMLEYRSSGRHPPEGAFREAPSGRQLLRRVPPGGGGEEEYLNLIREILAHGNKRSDRTGVGTISKFGAQMRFNLKGQFPLLTTKSVFFKGVAEELLWFLSGSTDAKVLSAKGVKIWDENGSRKFLDQNGFKDREEGELGPIYSHQWRHFGAPYEDYAPFFVEDESGGVRMQPTDPDAKGIDQIADVIHQIKTNPDSRRIILCSWNPIDIPKMVLPPCHCLAQFYVQPRPQDSKAGPGSGRGTLSCHMYQRSADMGLGVPFNIASYALLTYLLARETNLEPGELIHSLGDAHIYVNHIEQMQEQLKRKPYPFPTLTISDRPKNIFDVRFEDLTLHNYQHHPAIKMKMAL